MLQYGIQTEIKMKFIDIPKKVGRMKYINCENRFYTYGEKLSSYIRYEIQNIKEEQNEKKNSIYIFNGHALWDSCDWMW